MHILLVSKIWGMVYSWFVMLMVLDLIFPPFQPSMLTGPGIAVDKGAPERLRTKHIEFEIWICRDYVCRESVQLVYVHTDLQIADFFRKQLRPGL